MTTSPSTDSVPGTFRLEGSLDLYAAERLLAALRECLTSPGATIVLDLGGVSACDTAGVQLLLSARVTAEAGGRTVRFAAVPEPVQSCCAQLGLPVLN